ncbi:mobilization protein [Prevotella brunnea]|uniref:relaxase/mobilization nuclease domain-containing protein n=1 Tax=Prevotella brunnea TaxID=2508867 RepID=UPI002828CB1A|nr:relaxase/mobilization nuclease domain-containing protein [Prevotella brunnea]MDR0185335.1 mobilization protein [Prevotella brunnea]
MIATILHSSSTFNAVNYNERKVSKGTAELLEISNFDYLQKTGNITAANLQEYLIKYSSINQNIKNTQFHVSISCKKQEYTHDQLLDIAHQYLKEMGYADKGQPVLIYAHHDTGNNHIHIVTSRVNPQGKKIEHDNERLRSQVIINKIMGIEPKREVKGIIQKAMEYSFATLGQFQAILESNGYESYAEDDKLNVKKGGTVLDNISIKDIELAMTKKTKEESSKQRKRLKAILLKYKELTSNKEDLNKMLKKKLGISLVFVGKKDAPYGYMVVDHKNKAVYKGSEVLDIKTLLEFKQQENISVGEREKAILGFVHKLIEENDKLTIGEVNKSLWWKYRVNIYHDGYIRDKQRKISIAVEEKDFSILRKNFRRQWIQEFNPATEEERTILCKFGHIEDESVIQINPDKNKEKIDGTVNQILEILGTAERGHLYDDLHNAKILIFRKEESVYAVDMNNSTIVNLRDTDIDLSPLMKHERGTVGKVQPTSPQQTNSQHINAENLLRPTGSDHHSNREWEVGGGSNWDDIDDERRFKR